jgi:hypothetical protein
MATINNALFHGISGKLVSIVFRQKKGKTIVACAPRKRAVKTKKQEEHQRQFKLATTFAKTVMAEPVLLECYKGFAKKLKCPSAYSAAVKDFLKKPEIKNICVDRYRGNIGDVITITPADDSKFYMCGVMIVNADGTLEDGFANYDPAETEFNYVARKENYLSSESVVIVTLTDTPGHRAEELIECLKIEEEEEDEYE